MPIAPFRVPDQLNIIDGNILENYCRWKRQMEFYLAASGVGNHEAGIQVPVILHCAGPIVVEVFDLFVWDVLCGINESSELKLSVNNWP